MSLEIPISRCMILIIDALGSDDYRRIVIEHLLLPMLTFLVFVITNKVMKNCAM